MGEEGFSSDSSLLYHRGVPSAIVRQPGLGAAGPGHRRRTTRSAALHLRLPELFAASDRRGVDPVTGRRLVLGNADVRISYVVGGAASAALPQRRRRRVRLRRGGRGTVETVFGVLGLPHRRLRAGAARRRPPVGAAARRAGCTRSRRTATSPRRSATCRRYGQLLEHAPYCERDLHGPAEPLLVEAARDVEVLVKHRGRGPAGSSAPA